ncbi:MAG TPA: divalent cation tolerance protein CutA, partial [Micromonosporaceae bacterium]|nr:divalent cation tolerance protein CutA [Micromonosporaceae bacterium]
RWEGKVYDETQARVGLHTRASLVPEIVAHTDRDHADDVPCVISMPISNGNRACLRWVYSETRQRQRNAQGEPELLKSDSMRELFRLATRCTKLADSQSSLDPSERAAIRDELLTSPLYEMITNIVQDEVGDAISKQTANEARDAQDREDVPAIAGMIFRIALATLAAAAGGPVGALLVGDPVGREL